MVLRTRRRTFRIEMARPCPRGTERSYLRSRGERCYCDVNWDSLCLFYYRYQAPPFLNLALMMYILTRKAFNAFISTTVIIAQISFAIPALLLLLRRRGTHYLPAKRVFKVPDVIGYIANIVCVLWAVVEAVFFCFPASFPVTEGNMSMSPFRFLVVL